MEKELEQYFFPEKFKTEELPIETLKDEKNYFFFEGTVNSKKVKNSNYVLSLFDKKKNLIGRKYLDKDKKEKYFELFKNNKMDLLGISNNITFIHSPSNDKESQYSTFEFIGFRYYANSSLSKYGNFFTLIRRNYSDYFILEKNKSIKDMEGKLFFEEKLNCLQIIRKIIFNKYKKKVIGDNGDTFPEIIGYCFALLYLDKINKFKFVKPIIANLGMKNQIIDSIPPKNLNDNIYIEPFIYDEHISLIISSEANKKRYNIILDMSNHHFGKNIQNLIFLPKTLKSGNNIIFSPSPIQAYSSCCLWFYGEIECLLSSNKYVSFKDIFQSLYNNIDFYLDIINFLSQEIDGIKCLIKKEANKCDNDDLVKFIDFDRLFFKRNAQFYSFHKDIIFSKFLKINNFLDNVGYFMYLDYMTVLSEYQNYVNMIFGLKNQLLLNSRYLDFLSKNYDTINNRRLIEESIVKIDDLIKNFKKEYNYAFYHANMLSYAPEINNLMGNISIPFAFSEEKKNKVINFNYHTSIKIIFTIFDNVKKFIEDNVQLFSEDTISNELNSIKSLCFSVMNN